MADCPLEACVALTVPPAAKLVGQKEIGALTESLGEMLNDPNYSDVEFVCKDGGRVHACRLLLAARSAVLKSLLTNGMVESDCTTKEIPMPDITSLSMLAAVEFLYTGQILRNKLTMLSGFQTVHAARFLKLHKLEECVMHVVVAAVKEIEASDADLLAWCFTQFAELRVEGSHELDDVHSRMASKLQEHVDSYQFNNMSIPAFNLYLDASRSTNTSTVSFREYLRLRSILLWACSRVSSMAVEELRARLPDEKYLRGKGVFEALEECSVFSPSTAAADHGVSIPEPGWIEKLQEWIRKLHSDSGLSTVHVMLQCIHPQILVKIVEPLGIIPSLHFVRAFRFQALHAGKMNVLTWKKPDKDYGIDVKIQENGSVLYFPHNPCPNYKHTCHVRANMAINHDLCEWDIIIQEPTGVYARGLIYIGLHAPVPPNSEHWPLLLSSKGQLYSGEIPVGSTDYCNGFGENHCSTVRVHVDMELRTCAFTVDGEYCDVAFTNLPHEVYPIVMSTTRTKVRIELVSDANFI